VFVFILILNPWLTVCLSSGRSKGYGFVEFAHNKELSEVARSHLESIYTDDMTTLRCEFVKESLVTFESLHSVCLFVSHLPMEYSDCDGLKNIFSIVAPPVYCRVSVLVRRLLYWTLNVQIMTWLKYFLKVGANWSEFWKSINFITGLDLYLLTKE